MDLQYKQFKDAIENNYWFEFFTDDPPLWRYVEELHPDKNNDSGKHVLYMHKNIIVKYNQDQIIHVNLTHDKDFNHSQISKFSQADANAYPKYESQLEKLCKFMDLVLDSSPPESYNTKHLLMAMNHLDKLFVMNDAATIVNELEVQHPAVKILILASKAQQEEVGDGINLTISFADELLHGAEELIRMGLHPSEIIRMLLVV